MFRYVLNAVIPEADFQLDSNQIRRAVVAVERPTTYEVSPHVHVLQQRSHLVLVVERLPLKSVVLVRDCNIPNSFVHRRSSSISLVNSGGILTGVGHAYSISGPSAPQISLYYLNSFHRIFDCVLEDKLALHQRDMLGVVHVLDVGQISLPCLLQQRQEFRYVVVPLLVIGVFGVLVQTLSQRLRPLRTLLYRDFAHHNRSLPVVQPF